VGADYWIWPGRLTGLELSLSDPLGCLPGRALPARLSDGAGPARGAQGRRAGQTWHTARGRCPAQIARRAGHNITVLLTVYAHCTDGQDDITNRQIEHALCTRTQAQRQTASGPANRRYRPDPVRHMSVRGPHPRCRGQPGRPCTPAAANPRHGHPARVAASGGHWRPPSPRMPVAGPK
jgi:hypothetical protein